MDNGFDGLNGLNHYVVASKGHLVDSMIRPSFHFLGRRGLTRSQYDRHFRAFDLQPPEGFETTTLRAIERYCRIWKNVL